MQAFAHFDVNGLGVLGCSQFEAFLSSLALGLSSQEVRLIAETLAGPDEAHAGAGVSLGAFSEAITRAAPTDQAFGERWALEMAGYLVGRTARGGLSAFVGRSDHEVLGALPPPPPELGLSSAGIVERLMLWLPKLAGGEVDWAAAEEWRTAPLEPWRR